MRGKDRLISGPINTTLLLFALPTLGSSALQSANGTVDTIWIGRLISSEAVAATTNGNLVMFLLTSFVFGFGMAATILIGQSFGRGQIDDVRRIFGTAIGIFLPVSIVIAMTGWFFVPTILGLLGTPPEITPLALSFLRLTFLAVPALLLLTLMMMALRGSGDSMTPLIFMALAVALDVVLNPIFILGLGPAPALGIGGSALATAISNYVSLLAMIGYIYARDLPLRLRGKELRYIRPDLRILRQLFSKGLPIGIQMIVLSGAMLTMMTMINAQGVDTAAAFGASQQIWTYVQMPAMALGAAVSAMAAQNIGAGRWDRVDRITRSGVIFNILLTGGIVLLLTQIDGKLLQMFLGADGEAVAIGKHIMLLSTWGFVAFGVTMVLLGTIRANGQVIWPLIILFISMFPVRIGFAYGMRPLLGSDAIWLSFPVGMCATMLMAVLVYRYGGWRRPANLQVERMTEPATAEDSATSAESAPPGSPVTPRMPVIAKA